MEHLNFEMHLLARKTRSITRIDAEVSRILLEQLGDQNQSIKMDELGKFVTKKNRIQLKLRF